MKWNNVESISAEVYLKRPVSRTMTRVDVVPDAPWLRILSDEIQAVTKGIKSDEKYGEGKNCLVL